MQKLHSARFVAIVITSLRELRPAKCSRPLQSTHQDEVRFARFTSAESIIENIDRFESPNTRNRLM